MQECLVVFARSVEVLHEASKARAIEVQECGLNVVPSWRGILATNHGHEPFKDGLMRELLDRLKINDFRKGAGWSDRRCLTIGTCSPRFNRGVDHVGTSKCYPDASKTVALEQGQADRGKAAATAQTRLVDPDKAPDRRPTSRPSHVQSGNRQ